jgi:hypothetical protein
VAPRICSWLLVSILRPHSSARAVASAASSEKEKRYARICSGLRQSNYLACSLRPI